MVMDVFGEHSSYIYGLAIVVTIVALAISTRYSLRNFFNIRTAGGDALSSEINASRTSAGVSSAVFSYGDATGNDGDDEADEDDVASERVSDRQALSFHDPVPLNFADRIRGESNCEEWEAGVFEQLLPEQQFLEEKEVQCRQLAEIFQLMKEQQDQLGIGSMDDMQEQMKLYAI